MWKEYLLIILLYFVTNMGIFFKECCTSNPIATSLLNMIIAVVLVMIGLLKFLTYLAIRIDELSRKVFKEELNGKDRQKLITEFLK